MSEDDLPRLLSERYRLDATLGHGGMGVVYRGMDLMIKRPVAVKLIRAVDGLELDDEIAGRFLREARHTARLQHEHIIEVFDLGRSDEGGLYFVMELLEGEPLSARLRREGKMAPEVTVHIARQICDALQVAHHAGVVHRDLKPANVMLLSRAGDDDFVKVLDFGVAKSTTTGDQDTQLTHTGMLIGTVDYMAPEQITGKPVDGRTDIYALGVVLYRMLCGKAPFNDPGVPALIYAHLNTKPRPLTEVTDGVPNELDRVVLRCLAKNPERRFASMVELGRALEQAVADAGLVDLEYRGEGNDIYGDGDKTAVARSCSDAVGRRSSHDLFYDATITDGGGELEDATIRIDRPFVVRPAPAYGSPPAAPQAVRPRPPAAIPFAADPTSTLALSDELRRLEPKVCAMCQTVNAPHVRACVACGVSLASEDQDAVRARVRAGLSRSRTAVAPQDFAPRSGPHDAMRPGGLPPRSSSPPDPPSPLHGPLAPGWLTHQAPAPPRSIWRRFLTWTGLRGR